MPEPSPDLVRLAQSGDRAAWSRLIEEQQNYVYSIALSLMREPDDAADLTQEAFIRLSQTIGSFRGETRFTTWLYRLVVNLGLDRLRRRGRSRQTRLDDAMIDVPDDDPAIDPLLRLEQAELVARVRAALNDLPAPYRLALTLYYVQDLRYEEIARVMNLPLNTVKSHLRRGKLALARRLGAFEAQEAR